MTDKAVQFPALPSDSRTTVGSSPQGDILVGPDINSVSADPFMMNVEGLHSSSVSANVFPSFNAMNEVIKRNLPSSSSKLPDLKRSRIVFEGRTCVREFITQVEEYFLYKNFDEALLVGSFSDLLSGTAAKWFRAIRFSIASWHELKVALLKRFDKLEFDYFLEHELRTRKQKQDESLPDFITELMDLASRLATPLSEHVMLTIVKHNMLPIYLPYILGKSIVSLDAFVDLGKELEVFVCRKPVKELPKPTAAGRFRTNVVQSDVSSCLKCRSTGHSYRHCPKYPGIICFKCQKLGVTTKSCDVCNLVANNSTESKNDLGRAEH